MEVSIEVEVSTEEDEVIEEVVEEAAEEAAEEEIFNNKDLPKKLNNLLLSLILVEINLFLKH